MAGGALLLHRLLPAIGVNRRNDDDPGLIDQLWRGNENKTHEGGKLQQQLGAHGGVAVDTGYQADLGLRRFRFPRSRKLLSAAVLLTSCSRPWPRDSSLIRLWKAFSEGFCVGWGPSGDWPVGSCSAGGNRQQPLYTVISGQ
ncbi:hypothetical protein EYF80_054892 [Liparis tanakae]|uniref:Uncharacterized protein n=1 Tax=Liparis tanakae TaxID=230148 RepID=A0A4Z2F2N1_9TELE|nr:hypothetical protein EYF80_054892 [Liparis tanakae]